MLTGVVFCSLTQLSLFLLKCCFASATFYFTSEMCLSRPSNLFCMLQKVFESGFLYIGKCTVVIFSMSQSCFCITCSGSIINLNFYFSVEVGVRVEAYNCGEGIKNQAQHTNSAFLIFNTVNDKGELLTFPRIKALQRSALILRSRMNAYVRLCSPAQHNACHGASHYNLAGKATSNGAMH